jgi:hypothetical protein
MKDRRPFGIVLWGTVSNRHMLRWLKTVVVSDVEKASRDVRWGSGRRLSGDVSRI